MKRVSLRLDALLVLLIIVSLGTVSFLNAFGSGGGNVSTSQASSTGGGSPSPTCAPQPGDNGSPLAEPLVVTRRQDTTTASVVVNAIPPLVDESTPHRTPEQKFHDWANALGMTKPIGESSQQQHQASSTLLGAMDWFVDLCFNQSTAFNSHDHFLTLQRLVQEKLRGKRHQAILEDAAASATLGVNDDAGADEANSARTTLRHPQGCIEFQRDHDKAGDQIYRVPCIPKNTTRLLSVEKHAFGLWAKFGTSLPDHRQQQVFQRSNGGSRGTTGLSVAVEMSGHMRTWRKCWESTKKYLLAPNNASLFIASYPDLGDKRFGIRVQDKDDPVDLEEISRSFQPYLKGFYVADLPTVRGKLQSMFPKFFYLNQWSWMIYQLFMMELAHNMTLGHHIPHFAAGSSNTRLEQDSGYWQVEGDRHFVPEVLFPPSAVKLNQGGHHASIPSELRYEKPHVNPNAPHGTVYSQYDIVIRIRPDLHILGPSIMLPIGVHGNKNAEGRGLVPLANGIHFQHHCGGGFSPNAPTAATMKDPFKPGDILRAHHHPRIEWDLDPISDHSGIGFADNMTVFLRLFRFCASLSSKKQEQDVFFAGNTAERIWSQHMKRQGLNQINTFGWHIMLRNKEKWGNSQESQGSVRRRWLIQKVFGVTEAAEVGCPNADKSMEKYHSKKGARK